MASKKFEDLSKMSTDDLAVELEAAQREYHQMRFDNYAQGIPSTAAIPELRRDIARIKTEQRRRELEAMNDGQGRLRKLTRRKRLAAAARARKA